MRIERINNGLQLAAAVGVLAGLLLVAYELRQERELVRAQLGSETIAGYQDIAESFRDDETAQVYAMALSDPASLTFEEQIVLDGLFTEIVYAYVVRPNYLFVRGVFQTTPDRFTSVAGELILASEYGREWWSEHRLRFGPGARVAMDDEAANTAGKVYRESAGRILERTLKEPVQ